MATAIGSRGMEITPLDVDVFLGTAYGVHPIYEDIRNFCQAHGLPDIAVSDQQARMLTLLVQITGAERVLEIGTLGGLSTVAMALAGPKVHIDTLEYDKLHAAVAVNNFYEHKVDSKITLYQGDAEQTLVRLHNEMVGFEHAKEREPYDFVFIDADKESNLKYFSMVMPLVRPGGVIVVDNVVREGRCVTVEDKAEFLKAVAKHRFTDSCVVQTVGDKVWDGFVLARVTA